MKEFINWLNKENIVYYLNHKLKNYTTLHIGGAAKIIVEPCDVEDMSKVVKKISELNLKFFILGNGSNVLFDDEGYDGIIIHIPNIFNKIELLENNQVYVQSGATNAMLSNFTLKNELTGYEFACGIPGTIGGAIYMNAGAYDGETKDVIVSVRYLDKDGDIKTLTNKELDLSYRHSYFTDNFGLILDAIYQFNVGNKFEIKDKIDDLMKRRYDKQPMDKYSAGSTFKRPKGYYASKLIKDTGLKGYSVGDAKVSDKHAGFLINDGNASSKEFLQLIDDVIEKVEREYGVRLECEIKRIS